MDYTNILENFSAAIDEVVSSNGEATISWNLGFDKDDYNWAVVLGYAGGFEENLNDKYQDGEYHLCVKIARQPFNAMLTCGYEIDWELPYDEDCQETYFTEYTIYPHSNQNEIIRNLLAEMPALIKKFEII